MWVFILLDCFIEIALSHKFHLNGFSPVWLYGYWWFGASCQKNIPTPVIVLIRLVESYSLNFYFLTNEGTYYLIEKLDINHKKKNYHYPDLGTNSAQISETT